MISSKPLLCASCARPNHTAFSCPYKRRAVLKAKRPLKGKRRIRAIGKVGRQWIATRKEWIAKNLPDSGHWDCYYCGEPLYLNTLTLEHKKSRSRHPELRFDLSKAVTNI